MAYELDIKVGPSRQPPLQGSWQATLAAKLKQDAAPDTPKALVWLCDAEDWPEPWPSELPGGRLFLGSICSETTVPRRAAIEAMLRAQRYPIAAQFLVAMPTRPDVMTQLGAALAACARGLRCEDPILIEAGRVTSVQLHWKPGFHRNEALTRQELEML